MTTTTTTEFSVTTDVPAGVCRGVTFGTDWDQAAQHFANTVAGDFPTGTVVTMTARQGDEFHTVQRMEVA